MGKCLVQLLVDSTTAVWKKKGCEYQAALLFKKFRKYEFTGSHRFGPDTDLTNERREHRQILNQIRNDPEPLTKELLSKLPMLNEEDTKTDEWRFTPVMVTGNAERQLLNVLQIRRYAKFHNLPILSYYVKLKNAPNENSITRIAKNITLERPLTQVITFHLNPCKPNSQTTHLHRNSYTVTQKDPAHSL